MLIVLIGIYKQGLTEFLLHTMLDIMFEPLELDIPNLSDVILKIPDFFLILNH